MTNLADAPKGSFKLSMLLYDTRYRSMTIQIAALIGFMILIGWLINNTAQNLAALGKDPSFAFLWDTSNYDINQHLLDYTSQSTHLKATIVGLLNTLLVAFLGCLTATIVGVFVGVLRLSHNWLVARLMTIYVEVFRNVPVLLWIVFTMAILIETFPQPRDFRGENAEASMSLFGTVAVSNQGVYIPRILVTDYSFTLVLALIASVIGIFLLRRRAHRIQDATGVRPHTFWWSVLFATVPAVVLFFATSALTTNNQQSFLAIGDEPVSTLAAYTEAQGRVNYCHMSGQAASLSGMEYLTARDANFLRKDYFNRNAAERAFVAAECGLIAVDASSAEETVQRLSERIKDNTVFVIDTDFTEGRVIEVENPGITERGIPRFQGGAHLRNSLIALWLALSLYTAAFIAEIVRAGIMAISQGQTEAAGALGLRPGRVMNLVILPQALRVIVPPLISQYLNLTKNSSLAIAVGYMDITGTLMNITRNQTGRELESVVLGMALYLTLSLSISAVMNVYNKSVKLVER